MKLTKSKWLNLAILKIAAVLFFAMLTIPALATNTTDLSTDDQIQMGAWNSIAVCQSVIFGDRDLEISWDSGIIDIKYGNNVTKTEAADMFFDFLKRYIREGYRIIPKERK